MEIINKTEYRAGRRVDWKKTLKNYGFIHTSGASKKMPWIYVVGKPKKVR